jgi:hypothetical protein
MVPRSNRGLNARNAEIRSLSRLDRPLAHSHSPIRPSPASPLDFPTNREQRFQKPIDLGIERTGATVQVIYANRPGKRTSSADRIAYRCKDLRLEPY